MTHSRRFGRVIHNVTVYWDIWQPWFSPTIHEMVAILQETYVLLNLIKCLTIFEHHHSQFFPYVVYRKTIGLESFQDILGGQRDWLVCCQTGQSDSCQWKNWWKNLLSVSRPSSRWISHSSIFFACCFSPMSSAYWNRFKEERR
jgi:hypothetical protein